MTKMTTNTRSFEFAHGHKPRGFGYWGFEFVRADGRAPDQFWCTDTYADAVKAAHKSARACGPFVVEVKVCP